MAVIRVERNTRGNQPAKEHGFVETPRHSSSSNACHKQACFTMYAQANHAGSSPRDTVTSGTQFPSGQPVMPHSIIKYD